MFYTSQNKAIPISNMFLKPTHFSISAGYHPSKYNPNQLNKQELIILDALTDFSSNLRADIIQYLQNGGNVLFIPPSDTLFNPQYLQTVV
jgi:hypothetical protein